MIISVTTVLYTREDSANDLTQRLIRAWDAWNSIQGDRTPQPLYDGERIRRNAHGIGLQIDGLCLSLPSLYDGTTLSAVTVDENYVKGDGVLLAGTYRRGQTVATVTRRDSWRIQVTGKKLAPTVKFFSEIKTGRAEPKVTWPSGMAH